MGDRAAIMRGRGEKTTSFNVRSPMGPQITSDCTQRPRPSQPEISIFMTFEAPDFEELDEQTGRKLIVVAGPTGVGKTMLGVGLARRFNGEVINADSRYLYRGFNIGTAKPGADEQQSVPHHLIDILDPTDDFSLARYQEMANAAIGDVLRRGRLPLLVGGTPLYVNAVIEGWRIPRVPPQPVIRQKLEKEAHLEGVEALSARLAEIDPVAAERSGVNLRRIIRALEIFEVTGERMSDLEGKGPRPYQTLELGLSLSRPLLHDRLTGGLRIKFAPGLLRKSPGCLRKAYRGTRRRCHRLVTDNCCRILMEYRRSTRQSPSSSTIRTAMSGIRKPGCGEIRDCSRSM